MIRLIVFCLFTISSSANGFTIREAPESGSIDETVNVFSSIAEDKNFTNIQPEGNNTESLSLSDSPVEVTVDKEKEKTETEVEEEKIEIKPSTEATKPSTSSSTSTTTTSTSTSTTTSTTTLAPVPTNSSTVSTVIKPVVVNNDTDSMVDMSFVTNDSMSKDFFSSLDSIMVELNGSNDTTTTNNLEPASGGMPVNDELANYFELFHKLDGLEGLFEPSSWN